MKILSLGKVHPWKHATSWKQIVKDLPPEKVFIEGLTFECNWQVDLGLLLMQEYEPYVCRLAKKIICPGDIVLDVGANIGFFSLFFACCTGPSGHVYAYEPVKATIGKPRRNLELNIAVKKAEIEVRECGLSKLRGCAEINIPMTAWEDNMELGQASLIAGRINHPDRKIIKEKIRLTRLDDESIHGPVKLVKCDIEGAEKLFLEGARSTLSRDKPLMIFEFNPGQETYSTQDFIEIIRSLGVYSFFNIRYDGLRPIKLDDYKKDNCNNIIFCAVRKLHENRLAGLVKAWH